MTQDLQQLLEKIQRDGVDKAQAEADALLADAQAKAKSIVDTAQAEAVKAREEARREAESFERRAEETIRQAARDTLLKIEKAVTALFERILKNDINSALAHHPDQMAALAVEAARAYLADNENLEVAASENLIETLRTRLAADAATKEGVAVVTDEAANTGFRIRLAHGRIEHAFSGDAIAEALARQLRPRLAALLKPEP